MAIIISQRATLWNTKYKMPFAIGAIDCTHFKIKKPLNNSDEYICGKGFYSINVQATCNANELFTSVDVSWPGSVHDSRILKNSSVHNVIKSNDVEAYLLGDEGYGIAPWLMTPFKNPSNPIEALYNSAITKERTIIERCFGQLKQSGFVLHNIAKHLNDIYQYSTDLDSNIENVVFSSDETSGVTCNQIRENGKRKWLPIANMLSDNSN
ncbi:putative nuclease HARBI1 [Teleopsis dalmanni]|uniref:putative nuclease HARBI1 n=1 Tax=Teleopsis dalmanni TaxID=139649 RepID=UPI0018CC9A99|nr:putative nuclease HARBI1 [Teleopsis dalmanni]